MRSKIESMNYRVQVCGWSSNCFDSQGNQIYTPQELERAAQADDHSCPAGICIAARGDMLTGAHGVTHAQALEAETTARLAILCKGEKSDKHNQEPDIKQLPDGGAWVKIGGGQEIRQESPIKISLWDWVTGKI